MPNCLNKWMNELNESFHFAMNSKCFRIKSPVKANQLLTKEHLITTISINWTRHTTKQIMCYWFKLNSLTIVISNNRDREKRKKNLAWLMYKNVYCYKVDAAFRRSSHSPIIVNCVISEWRSHLIRYIWLLHHSNDIHHYGSE